MGGSRLLQRRSIVRSFAKARYPSSIACTRPPREGRMAIHLRRREFIFTLGGAAAAWPLAARAQQPERMRRIGVLMGLAESDPEGQSRIVAFRKTLQDLGWTEGRNVQ